MEHILCNMESVSGALGCKNLELRERGGECMCERERREERERGREGGREGDGERERERGQERK